jgi:hypothetical protein
MGNQFVGEARIMFQNESSIVKLGPKCIDPGVCSDPIHRVSSERQAQRARGVTRLASPVLRHPSCVTRLAAPVLRHPSCGTRLAAPEHRRRPGVSPDKNGRSSSVQSEWKREMETGKMENGTGPF